MTQEQEIIEKLKKLKNEFIKEAQKSSIHKYVKTSKAFLTQIQEYKNTSPQVDALINQYYNLVYQTLQLKMAEEIDYDENAQRWITYMESYLPKMEDSSPNR